MSLLAISLFVTTACAGEDGGSSDPHGHRHREDRLDAGHLHFAVPAPSPSPSPTVAEPPAPTPQIDFERTGNLVRDNPGVPPGSGFSSTSSPGPQR